MGDKEIKKKKREHDSKKVRTDKDKKGTMNDKKIKKKKREHAREDNETDRAKKRTKKDRMLKKKKREHDRKSDKIHKDRKGTKKENKDTTSRKTKSRCALCGKQGTQKRNVYGRQCCATGRCRGAYKNWKEGKSAQKVRATLHKLRGSFRMYCGKV